MPFASYSSRSDVARAYRITLVRDTFVEPLPMAVPDVLRAEIAFAQRQVGFDSSEFAACENLIYPILKEVWRAAYLNDLQIWSHIPLNFDADLSGIPDYFVARRSPLGVVVVEEPYLLVVEGKKDDFERGWGQCLAAMLAAQKLNGQPNQVLYGIVTNGVVWECGKLRGTHFVQDLQQFTLSDLDRLCAAVNYLFAQCREQLARLLAMHQ
jgi:hypothetical protein